MTTLMDKGEILPISFPSVLGLYQGSAGWKIEILGVCVGGGAGCGHK